MTECSISSPKLAKNFANGLHAICLRARSRQGPKSAICERLSVYGRGARASSQRWRCYFEAPTVSAKEKQSVKVAVSALNLVLGLSSWRPNNWRQRVDAPRCILFLPISFDPGTDAAARRDTERKINLVNKRERARRNGTQVSINLADLNIALLLLIRCKIRF
jgi:hypothetical protein